jgi:hypothetical protein
LSGLGDARLGTTPVYHRFLAPVCQAPSRVAGETTSVVQGEAAMYFQCPTGY